MSQPFRCPVCDGKGFTPIGFYNDGAGTADASVKPCRSCAGTGIVWGPSAQRLDTGADRR